MKTKQCHHFIALIGLLIGCLLPATVGASVKVGNLYYNLNASDLTAEVTDEGEPGNFEITPYTEAVISIPASINYGDNTYRVTSIGPAAFSGCTALTSVNIPNSVTSIGESAFTDCTGLTSVDIPNSVTSISATAFYNCTSLTSVNIPNSVTSIGESAFGDCPSLAFVTIPNSVTSISRAAFHDCTSLTSIVIPNSLTSIDEYTFDGCTGLTSVYIPISVTSIGQYAFGSCTGLTSITCESETPIGLSSDVFDGVDKSNCTLYVPNRTVEAYRNADFWSEFTNIEELTLNVDGIYYNVSPSTMTASVTKKPSGYYSGDITIPETVSLDDKTYRVTEIEELAFYDCKSLTSVTIPNGVTSIGYQAFYNCTRLTSIDIPSSVTSIGRGAFSNCTGLTSVTIPNGVTSIEPETFNMCNSLASVIIPNGVTSIGSMAFCRCFDLTSVTIPNGVTSIGYEAFLYCTGLTSVTIPNSVTSISNEAFSNCTSLTSFTCQNETPVTITNSVFSGVNKSTCTLNVPTGSKSAYQSADVWKDFSNIVEYEGASPSVLATGQCGDNLTYTIYEDLSMVIAGTGAMWNYNSDNPMNSDYKYIIKSVTIEEGCTAIGTYAFFDCSGLTSVDIPSSVTTIGEEAFQHCTGLTSVDIPNSVMSIGEDAFLNCRALTTISVDAGNSIYDSRNDCNAIIETSTNKLIVGCRNTVIPNSVTSIGMNALACCTGLTSVDIPNSVTSIDDFAFQFCTGLTSVSIPNSVSSIAGTAFGNCTGLTSIYVDASNATYDSRENCNAIIETSTNTLIVGCKNTVIPSSVTSIGQSAFDGCTGLTSVDIPNGVTSIDWCAFQDCIGLTSVSIPNRVTRIGQYAFYRCTSLSSISVGMTTPLVINDNVFYDVNKSTCTLYVPTGSKSAYQSADVWKDFTNIVEYEGASSVVLATGQCGDNLTYTIYDDMSMVISGTGAMWDYVAEDTHPNQDYYSDVKSVTIEEGCTYVGKYAFDLMGSLTDVTIPGSVIEIGTGAFSYCRQLSSLELSAGLKIIGGGAFECCGRQDSGLKSITIPSTVTSIGGAAFTSCYLNSITVESSFPLTIQANTFASTDVNSCTLYVPTGSKSAYQNADVWKDFTNIVEYEGASPSVLATGPCGDNLTYTIYDDMSMVITGTGPMWDYSEESMMNSDYMGSIKSVTIEEGCTAIGAYAFNCCYEVTSVTFPNSLTAISECAFKYCVKLISLNIPNGVIAIGDYAFDNCCNLSSITVDDGNTAYDSRDNCNAIINSELDKLILGCKNTVIPVGVTSIGERAFIGCQGLTSIDIPDGVTEIGWWAFMSCHDLTTVSIPHGVTQIGAFAFLDCNSLTSVAIPNSVTYLGGNAFTSCTGLTSVTVEWNTPLEIESNVFENVDKSACILYVPTGTKSAYQSADVWKDFTNIVEYEGASSVVLATGQCGDNLTYTIYDDMSMVITGKGAMWNYSYDAQINSDYMGSIKSVTIEEGCTTIGSYAFSCFSGLTSVDIPSSVTSIGDFAFFDCEGLTSVDIPNSVTSIGEYAFYFCTGLTSITIPNSVTSIDRCAFQGCTGLTTVTIPSSVSSIDATSFSDLTSIYVDESNATYDSRENCNAIIETSTNTLIAGCKNTVIPNSVTSIGGNAFAGCTGLTSIDIPNSVTYIGGAAFQYCTGLTSVDIPSSVTYIGYTAFSGCTSLSSISVGMTTPISIFNDAFYDVNKSTCTLYVPAGSKTAYENALYWSEFENIVEIGEGPVTDISEYDNIVYIEGAEAVVGQRVRLSLKMNNTIAPTGFQCDIYLPDGVTPVMGKDEEGKDIYLMDISTERTTSEKTNVSDCVLQSDGSLRFMCSSTKSYTFSGYEGEVAYLMVDIDPNLEEGTYPLILKNVRISDANAVKYTVDYVKTTLQISTYTVGDANNDGDVDVADFTAIANYILSRPSVSFVEKAADVNADNEIDVADLTGVANLILYGSVSPNASHAKARNDAAAKYVSIEANDVTATKDEEFIVAVTIDGNYAYSGYQFDVTLPEGMTVKDVFGQTTASDVFMSGMIDDNTLRVLCASITGETAESTVVNLTLMADSEGTYSIDIDNAIVSVNASSCAMRNSSFLVAIENEVTGISTLFDEASSNASVYDLTGKKLKSNGNTSSLPKGIYIINGKKVSK